MDSTKIHPTLQSALEPSVRSLEEATTLPIIVRYRPVTRSISEYDIVDTEEAPSVDMRTVMAINHTYTLIPAMAGAATPATITQLSDQPAIEMIWLDEEVYAFLDTSLPKIGVPRVWDASGNRGAGIKIAIIDTGIDANHPDFGGRLEAVIDFTGQGAHDNNGHGTHVASIAAGSGASSEGRYQGVAPEATLLSAKVLRADGKGRMSDVLAGVEWAVEQGAQILNLSLGSVGPCDGTDAISTVCNAAVQQGVVVCAASGNEGPGMSTVGAPGCATDVITVGASDDDDKIAPFSSRGPTSDGRPKPDILFPGVHIIAARSSGTSMGIPEGEHYTNASGTSMATPHAAGTCALLLHAKPDLTPAAIKSILRRAAIDLGFGPNTQGAGRVDVVTALTLIDTPEAEPTPPTPTPPPVTPLPTPPPYTPPPATPAQGCMTKAVALFRGDSS